MSICFVGFIHICGFLCLNMNISTFSAFSLFGTARREDEWGGSYENRIRFPVSIVEGVRKACGDDFIIIYRLSILDLIKDGSSW